MIVVVSRLQYSILLQFARPDLDGPYGVSKDVEPLVLRMKSPCSVERIRQRPGTGRPPPAPTASTGGNWSETCGE
jgi:hypothetical protein